MPSTTSSPICILEPKSSPTWVGEEEREGRGREGVKEGETKGGGWREVQGGEERWIEWEKERDRKRREGKYTVYMYCR